MQSLSCENYRSPYGFDQSRRIFRLDHFTGQNFLTKPRQDRTPQRRPGQGHYGEGGEIHPNDSSWNGNDMADHRQKARKKNAPCFVATNPSFGALEFILAEQEIATPPGDENPSEPQCSPIGPRCPKPRTECARHNQTECV